MRLYLLTAARLLLFPSRRFSISLTARPVKTLHRSRKESIGRVALMEWKLISAGEVEARDDDEPIERSDLPRRQ